MQTPDATQRLHDHVFAEDAVEDIREYFTEHQAERRNHTGRFFGRIGLPDEDPHRFTHADLLALSMVGASVPAAATLQLLGLGDTATTPWHELLSAVPDDVHITKVAGRDMLHGRTDDGEPRPSAHELYDAVASLPGLTPTQASLLLHRKRPKLIPIWTFEVELAIRPQGQWWSTVANLLADDGTKVRFESMREQALDGTGVPGSEVSLIRLIDVILWMRYGDQKAPVER